MLKTITKLKTERIPSIPSLGERTVPWTKQHFPESTKPSENELEHLVCAFPLLDYVAFPIGEDRFLALEIFLDRFRVPSDFQSPFFLFDIAKKILLRETSTGNFKKITVVVNKCKFYVSKSLAFCKTSSSSDTLCNSNRFRIADSRYCPLRNVGFLSATLVIIRIA